MSEIASNNKLYESHRRKSMLIDNAVECMVFGCSRPPAEGFLCCQPCLTRLAGGQKAWLNVYVRRPRRFRLMEK